MTPAGFYIINTIWRAQRLQATPQLSNVLFHVVLLTISARVNGRQARASPCPHRGRLQRSTLRLTSCLADDSDTGWHPPEQARTFERDEPVWEQVVSGRGKITLIGAR